MKMLSMAEKCRRTITFATFFYCDSGMIPWLLIIELISKEGISLSQAVNARQWRYPSSGEINLRLTAPAEAIAAVKAHFLKSATKIDENRWAFRWHLRITTSAGVLIYAALIPRPVVRLNIESFANNELMKEKNSPNFVPATRN